MLGNIKGPRKIRLFTCKSYGPICVSTFLAKKHVWWILKLITAGVVAKAPVSLQEAGWKPAKGTNRTSKSRKRREKGSGERFAEGKDSDCWQGIRALEFEACGF